MAKYPYGHSVDEPSKHDDPWTKLATINEHLEACEVVPPDLARWLGLAITFANEDPNELLRRLGLKSGRGPKARDPLAVSVYGRRLCELEDGGVKREEALSIVLSETNEKYSRSQLQNFRDEYRTARRIALNPE